VNLVHLFRSSVFDLIETFINNVPTASNKLIFKLWNLVLHTKVNIGVQLQKKSNDLLINLGILAINGDVPKRLDAFHIIRLYSAQDLYIFEFDLVPSFTPVGLEILGTILEDALRSSRALGNFFVDWSPVGTKGGQLFLSCDWCD
jgi:hypothetical protein